MGGSNTPITISVDLDELREEHNILRRVTDTLGGPPGCEEPPDAGSAAVADALAFFQERWSWGDTHARRQADTFRDAIRDQIAACEELETSQVDKITQLGNP